jgi:hypothetical protein
MTILDRMFAARGELDPSLIGVHQASAADTAWVRNKGENERDFLAGVVCEAAAAGYRVVSIAGALQVSNIIQLRPPVEF